jgi:putative ABC transport system permease protein
MMAHSMWKEQNPLGKVFSFGSKNGPWKEVVGVVGDVKQWGLTHPPQPEAYDAFDGSRGFFIVVHTSSQSLSITPEVRNALARLDSTLPLYDIRTMDEVVAENTSGEQFLAMLLGLFSGLALLLAAVGIYGVLSYLVTQRTREIGIRMSLGASRTHVLSLVLKHGMRLAAVGFAAGLVAALVAGRLLSGLLHEVHPSDPGIMVGTAMALSAVAFAACYLPAKRAAKVDPIVALRHE